MQTHQPIAAALRVTFIDSHGKRQEAYDNGAYFNGEKVLAIRSGGFASFAYIREHHEIVEFSGVLA